MSGIKSLKEFVFNLKGEQLFNTGIVGSTSTLQQQLLELRKSLVELQANLYNPDTKDNFRRNLLTAHAVSLITDNELQQCETWLEES